MNTMFFLWETIKEKTPQIPQRYNQQQKKNPKTIRRSPDSSSLSLSYALQLSVSECMLNREARSLFILIPDLKNNSLGPTSLGESNNPRAQQLR